MLKTINLSYFPKYVCKQCYQFLFLSLLLQAMTNSVIKLSLCFCLLLIVVGDCRFQKIFCAKRNFRVKSVYFVHLKPSVTTAKIHDYVSELNSIPGFDIELHGIAQEVAYRFSAKVALQKVSKVCKLYYKMQRIHTSINFTSSLYTLPHKSLVNRFNEEIGNG